MNTNLRSSNSVFLKGGILCAALLILSSSAFATVIYSRATGNWTSTTSWFGGVVPVDGDTVVIQSGHTISVVGDNLYSNSTYMFLIIVGTLDLSANGKMSFDGSSKVIVETGGRVVGNGNSDTISIGTGGAEYNGSLGTITGPSYVSNGHTPSTGEGTGGCGCYNPGVIPLPVTLLFFDGETSDGTATLFWATVTEQNVDKFIIERSSDGLSYAEIGWLPGAGYDSKIRLDYTHVDKTPVAGNNYYRLKSVDKDGTFDYSDVIVLAVTQGKSTKEVSLFPNPSNGQPVEVHINFEPQQYDRIQVVDVLGVTLFELPVTSTRNSFQPSDWLKKGVYQLRFVSMNFTQTIRFVVN
jgi:hypothetical protein